MIRIEWTIVIEDIPIEDPLHCVEWVLVSSIFPTCVNVGTYVYVCRCGCGVERTEHVEPLRHNFVEGLCSDTPNGRYEFGTTCYVAVSEYETKTWNADLMPEAHETYIDVQYLACGEERILYTDKSALSLTVPYDAQKDVAFYRFDGSEREVAFSVGEAVILDTCEAHLPCIATHAPITVKKAVMKVKKEQ